MFVITRNMTLCRDLLVAIDKQRVENRINKENKLKKNYIIQK